MELHTEASELAMSKLGILKEECPCDAARRRGPSQDLLREAPEAKGPGLITPGPTAIPLAVLAARCGNRGGVLGSQS